MLQSQTVFLIYFVWHMSILELDDQSDTNSVKSLNPFRLLQIQPVRVASLIGLMFCQSQPTCKTEELQPTQVTDWRRLHRWEEGNGNGNKNKPLCWWKGLNLNHLWSRSSSADKWLWKWGFLSASASKCQTLKTLKCQNQSKMIKANICFAGSAGKTKTDRVLGGFKGVERPNVH